MPGWVRGAGGRCCPGLTPAAPRPPTTRAHLAGAKQRQLPGEQQLFSICCCIYRQKRCLATVGAWLPALDVALGGGDFRKGFLHQGVSLLLLWVLLVLFAGCVGDTALRAVALPLVWCRLSGVRLPVLGKCHKKRRFHKPGVTGPAHGSCALPPPLPCVCTL